MLNLINYPRRFCPPFKNALKIAEKYHASALCAEAVSYDFTKSENWRCVIDGIRTTGALQNLTFSTKV